MNELVMHERVSQDVLTWKLNNVTVKNIIVELQKTRQVSSMIHSAIPTVSPVVNIVFAGNLFCFARFWKMGKNIRTDNMCENNDHYRPSGSIIIII